MEYEIRSDQVQELASWAPGGDSIPHPWYRTICRSGKAHHQAISLLGRIVYMYRPVFKRDPQTGLEVGVAQKFIADMWQQSREALANHFGYTKKEVDSALITLKQLGLVTTELRTIVVNGQRLSNVLYVGINARKIKEISTPMLPRVYSSVSSRQKVSQHEDRALLPGSNTNTKTTLQITHKTTTGSKGRSLNAFALKDKTRSGAPSSSETIDPGILQEMVVGTILEGIVAESLRGCIAEFGVPKTLNAVDILRNNKKPVEKAKLAAYVYGSLTKGLSAPEQFVPFGQKKIMDNDRRERQSNKAVRNAAHLAEAEERLHRDVLAAQAKWLALPEEVRIGLTKQAKARMEYLNSYSPEHLHARLAEMFCSGRLSITEL